MGCLVVLFATVTTFFATTIVVDPGARYQTMRGWGRSLCWFRMFRMGSTSREGRIVFPVPEELPSFVSTLIL